MKVARQEGETKQRKIVGLRLDPKVWHAVRVRAAEMSISTAELVESAIEEYLRRLARKRTAA
jgi:hypothetical protein